MDRILCVAGPTASGKTDLAAELALRLNGEVISCDSMQVYRRMNIGTAKPSIEEMRGVPHHMLDVAEPGDDFTAGRYAESADLCVRRILDRGRLPIVAGGTGLYMDALVKGESFMPKPEPELRAVLEARLKKEGPMSLYRQLEQADPESAAVIHPNNEKRVLRALEAYLSTGKTMSRHIEESKKRLPKYRAAYVGLDYQSRETLYGLIDRRVDEMLEKGLLQEVKALLDSGVPENCNAMQAIGYRQLCDYLRGRSGIGDAVEAVKRESRRYAKRQLTWFRRNPEIFWIYREINPDTAEAVLSFLRNNLFFDEAL